jgi:peroxiredoxin Q/BCP
MTEKLQIGDTAPAFTAEADNGQTMNLADFASSWLVLYFYPKDDTPGCTVEANDFTSYLEKFLELGAKVVGVSPDSVKSHCKFIEKHKLKITLLSDLDHQLAESYKVWGLKKFMGKEYMGINRSTFLIDPSGKIAQCWYGVKVEGHVDNVYNSLKSLLDKG